jgi:hypothetical protein
MIYLAIICYHQINNMIRKKVASSVDRLHQRLAEMNESCESLNLQACALTQAIIVCCQVANWLVVGTRMGGRPSVRRLLHSRDL